MEKDEAVKKPRILCLHGHGVSAEIMKEELKRWPEFVLEKMDLVYINAPFPVDDSGLHYEWFQSNEDFSEFWKFDECMAYIEDNMVTLGPFDGILGVSQGALIAAASPGMQSEGVALTKVPKIKFVIIISGGKFGGSVFSSPELAKNAFSSPIEIPSLHFIGEHDFAKENGLELLEAFVDPTVIYHHEGHGVPHLDEEGLKIMLSFLEKIQKLLLG